MYKALCVSRLRVPRILTLPIESLIMIHEQSSNMNKLTCVSLSLSQVPRILTPVVLVLEELPPLYKKPGLEHLATCIDSMFGGWMDKGETVN